MGLGFLTYSLAPLTAEHPNQVLWQTSQALNRIAQSTSPAVVSIYAIKHSNTPSFDSFPDPADTMLIGIGSGVILNRKGLILTNSHVIESAEVITVTFDEKHKSRATLVGSDPKTDLAVLKVDEKTIQKDLVIPSLGDSDRIQVGDWTLAIGSPFGLNRSVTSGIVSAISRGKLGMLDIEDFIQTDTPINPGNSGGPLLNANGEIIGINTAIFSQSGGFVGIGFAVPSKIAAQVYQEIIHYGRVRRGWAGITAQDLDGDLKRYFKSPTSEGALVSRALPNSPASQATIQEGDIILQYGKEKVQSSDHLKTLVAQTELGSRVPCVISRNGEKKVLNILIHEQPQQSQNHSKQLAGKTAHTQANYPCFGLSVQDIPSEFFGILGISTKRGVLVSRVKTGSPAFFAGITTGDVLLKANKTQIKNAKDFLAHAEDYRKEEVTVFYVQRGLEERIFIPVKSITDSITEE